MIWLVFQSSIIFAVVASNIHWHWTPNGYAQLVGKEFHHLSGDGKNLGLLDDDGHD